MPLSRWEGTLSVRSIQAPARAVRSPGWGFFRLSEGRARQAPGPLGRSGGASSPGPVLTASGGRRCASPRGPAQGCSSPGRPLSPRQEPGGRGPSSRPQLQLVFVASSRSTACPRLAALWFARGWGGRLLRGCTHLQRPGFSPGMHRPPQVAKSGGENAPAPPPPARSPGCWGRGSRRAAAAAAAAAGGGGSGAAPGASAPRNNQSRWRWADVGTARRMVHWAFELSSCSRTGARRALTRPWPPAARGSSRGLSLKPPGARRRLASPRARVPRAAPHKRRALLFASPGAARSLSAEPPARLSCSLLRSGPTDRR